MTKGVAAGFFSTEISAYDNAIAYAGDEGRVLTMPDLCLLRSKADIGDPLWGRHFTSSSSEFYGLSKGGVPVVAVLHGGGPLSDFDVFAGSMEQGCRVDAAVFMDVLDGKFGEVAVVDFATVTSERQYPFAPLTAEQVLSNPLWVARMGGLDVASAYITRHAMVSLAVREAEGDRHDGHAGLIIRMEEAEERYTTIEERSRHELWYAPKMPNSGVAAAHLLVMGAAFRSGIGGIKGLHYVSSIGPLGRGDAMNFSAVASGEPERLVQLPSPMRLYDVLGKGLLVPHDRHDSGNSLFVIRGENDLSYACLASDEQDDGDFAHPISSFVEVGRTTFRQEPLGYYGVFKYNVADVRSLVPAGANAFKFSNLRLASSDLQEADLTFYQVEVDETHRLPTSEDLMASPKLVAAAIAAFAG